MKRFVKFCAVGVANTIISFVTFYVLSEILGVNYLISSFTGYVAGVANSFILNKKWTFGDNDNKVLPQFLKFAVLNVFSLGINLLIMYICVDKFNLLKTLSQIIATGATTVVNYIGSKTAVFDSAK
ncbi:GtrA family protein [Fonticella tunisiensis]|uniref:Putative flippase GtrA n=1 Tax=Fonticella tunisiensis TaxID=1096341 RepID=A0A4R7KDF5_9CLOT|nr:GtrA family protein [Fonticella tunisiensis]TDT50818.1 putative flippase GtrA [Fonticella tunisiensis]